MSSWAKKAKDLKNLKLKHYHVYILTNKNNKVLYTGVTNDLLRRAYEHKIKMVEGFTKRYNVNKLVYFEHFTDINDAIAAEKKIKGWLRIKKINLIKSKNPTWKDLLPELQENSATDGLGRDPSLRSGWQSEETPWPH